MKRLARAPNIALATLWADRLSQAGFAASVQRYYLSGIAGELPPDQCQPEIWLADGGQLDAAQAMLSELQNPPQHRWQCACGELIEGGFEQCWHCGVPK